MDYYIKSAKNQPSIIDSFLIIGYDIQEQEIKMSGDGEITLVNPNPTVLSEVSAFNTTRHIILENQLIYNILHQYPFRHVGNQHHMFHRNQAIYPNLLLLAHANCY